MRNFKYFLVVFIATLSCIGAAKAEVVKNYTMNFNKYIDTSAHDFKVASGWGHIVSFYHDDSYGQDYYVSYDYTSDGGRDGGALACGQQGELGGGYFADGTASDLLVTPKVKGNVSIYVKKYGYTATGIKFYKVTKNGDSFTAGEEITPKADPDISYSTWSKVELPELTEESFIGIWASSVYIDDFSADQADVVKTAGMTVSKVKNNGSEKPFCNAEGKFTVDLTATIENTGDLELTPGMENYSLSVVNTQKNDAVMFTVPVSVGLAVGEKADVRLQGEVDGNIYPDYNKYNVRENFGGSTAFGAWLTPVPYKPILEVRGDNGKVDSGESFAYGMINKNETKAFRLKNAGGAPLENLTVTLPKGFISNFTDAVTLASGEEKALEITADVTTPGAYSGDAVISGNGIGDFKLSLSATVLDAKKFYVTFEDQKIPAGSYIEQNWSIEQRDYSSNDNVYLLKNNRTGADDKFVTPLLKVAEGESLSFDACRVSSWAYGDDYYLNVYYSADRQNWTLARKIMSAEMSSESGSSSYNYQYGKLTNFVVDNIPAGNYYIAFGAGYTCIDNIYGFEPVDVKHDILFKSADLPKAGMVNYAYNAKATFRNLNSKPEAAGTYSASLYFGNDIVATAESAEIAAGEDATFNFSYIPHEAGTFEAYVKFENKADNLQISSEKVNVTISEENLKSVFTIGSGSSKAANVFAYWYNADNTNGANCDVIYPADMLAQYGLAAGAKIKSLTYRGTTNNMSSDATLAATTLEARVGLIDEASFVPNENYGDMPLIKVYDNETVSIKKSEDFVTTVNLATPLVWDGTSALRLFTNVKSSSYASVYYPCDDEVAKAYSYVYSLSSPTKNPIVDIEIEANPAVLSGKVYCGDDAVADANVVLSSDDGVVYNGKTSADGTYSFPVYQSGKNYRLSVTAEGYFEYTSEDYVTFNGDKVINVPLKSMCVTLSGKVTYRKAPVAGVKVILSHKDSADQEATTDEEGSYKFIKVRKNWNYTIKTVGDKFIDYSSADSVAVGEEDYCYQEIILNKPAVKVSGSVVCDGKPVAEANIELLPNEGEGVCNTKSDSEGKFELEAEQDIPYTLSVKADKYENYVAENAVVLTEDKNLDAIELVAKFFTLTVPETNYMTFSSSKAVDFNADGLEAYIVTEVKPKNDAAYTVLKRVEKVPANTGVIIYGPLGEYTVDYTDEADAIEGNLLVANVSDAFYGSESDNGKVWALDYVDFNPVFKSGIGVVIPQGGAYLRFDSSVKDIYLYEKDVPEASAISSACSNDSHEAASPMYNLAGQKVKSDYKGIVIQNGRKINRK